MKTNFQLRYASHPCDAKSYDTSRLRNEFLIETVFTPDEINLVYSFYDRLIVGGIQPVQETLSLEPVDILRAEYFTERREVGIINVGGAGSINVDGVTYSLGHKEALYIGRGNKTLLFSSDNPEQPALFYMNSAPAHTVYPTRKITRDDAIVIELGSLEESNHRVINRMIVREVLPTCQLQMGMTELKPGSVWNTMPPHTHDRRMEAYFYFDLNPANAVCHFMGETDETRHIWMKNHQAVISPSWSIHSACATKNYTFIWGMAGENLDYNDMDGCNATDLK